jgi:hypothetical protein
MAMMLKVREDLQWSQSLLARSVPTSNTQVQTNPFAANWAALGAPSAGGHKQKRLLTIPKCKQIKTLTVLVMTHIELPPYHGPKSPMDLVTIEIIFGHLFEAFQRTS